MAKGVEDTAFYSFNRMLALNEVGGDPDCFGVTAAEFVAWCRRMHRQWPRTMLATSTHDTKRSEDVRARLFLLSEEPERWSRAVIEWAAINERHRSGEMPDRNFEYHLYQSMVGAWPIEKSRMLAYAEKAAREAKVHTSWTDPVPAYEDAVRKFIDGIYDDYDFIESLNQFVASLIHPGRINSLAQTLLKLTAPGVPDFYQGTELWNLALVDPDNRRPQDFDLRRRMLADLRNATRRTGDEAFRRGDAQAVADPQRTRAAQAASGMVRPAGGNRAARSSRIASRSRRRIHARRIGRDDRAAAGGEAWR